MNNILNQEKNNYLVWIDMEMTGLDPKTDKIIEIATIITDFQLNIVAEGPNLIIHQDEEILNNMDPWCIKQHGKSGLIDESLRSTITCEDAEKLTIQFLKAYITPKSSPLCGNSVWQDRRFLIEYMKNLDEFLHYRIIDVSTIKELYSRWGSQSIKFQKTSETHRALADIKESIEELKFYKQYFFIDKSHNE